MTLKEFNTLVESWGATDDTDIGYMDMNYGGVHSILEPLDVDIMTGKDDIILLRSRFFYDV